MQSVKCHGNRGEFFYKYSLFFLSFSSQYYHQKGGNNSSKIVFYGWYKNFVKIIPSYQQNDFLLLERHEIASKLAIKTIKNIKTGRFCFLNVWDGMSLRQVVGGRIKVATPHHIVSKTYSEDKTPLTWWNAPDSALRQLRSCQLWER